LNNTVNSLQQQKSRKTEE